MRDSQALARGELPRIQDALHPGPLGQVARAINTTLDRLGTGTFTATPLPPPFQRRSIPTPTSIETPRKKERLFDEGAEQRATSPTLAEVPSKRDTPLPAPLPPRSSGRVHAVDSAPRSRRDPPPLRLGGWRRRRRWASSGSTTASRKSRPR